MNPGSSALLRKYLRGWAEPDCELMASRLACYHAVLVVPAMGESIELLNGYQDACAAARGRVLVVLVVNASDTTEPRWLDANQVLLETLTRRAAFVHDGAMLSHEPRFDLLTIARSSAGRRLPPKQGVGLARKIGADVATALAANGRLEQPLIYFTDADARLPRDYFLRVAASLDVAYGAVLFPFRHASSGKAATDDATHLYELSIRYHVLGLAYADSPYAYQSVGSALAVTTQAYAAVRGVPKRQAGEDFYLLDKVAKVAPLLRLGGDPICVTSRHSARVPFGTGPAVEKLLSGSGLRVADPMVYAVLKRVIRAIHGFCDEHDVQCFERAFGELPEHVARVATRVIQESGLVSAALDAVERTGAANLPRRIHTWFDSLRTLRFLHALRDAGLPEVDWQTAFQSAPFVPGPCSLDIGDALQHVTELESRLLPLVGLPGARRT